MRMTLNGKGLSPQQMDAVLETVGCALLHETLVAQGYRLQKIRAPRSYPTDGRWRLAFCWKYCDPDGNNLVVRMNTTLDVSPA